MSDMKDLADAIYLKLYGLSGSIPYNTLVKHHDFSDTDVSYPLVAIEFNKRERSTDNMSWWYTFDILVCVEIEGGELTPIEIARATCDAIVEAIDEAIDAIPDWPDPKEVVTEFGYLEEGTTPLYFGLLKATFNWARSE